VEHLYPDLWGYPMHSADTEPLDPQILLRWGYRFLWVLLFLSCMVVMGKFHHIITFCFLGASFLLLLPVIFSQDELLNLEEGENTETNRYEDGEHIDVVI